MSHESVMPSNHLILCHRFLLLSLIFPSIRVFSSESALCIRWPEYWSFSFSIRIDLCWRKGRTALNPALSVGRQFSGDLLPVTHFVIKTLTAICSLSEDVCLADSPGIQRCVSPQSKRQICLLSFNKTWVSWIQGSSYMTQQVAHPGVIWPS